MINLMCALFCLLIACQVLAESETQPYINTVAVDPRFDVFTTGTRTQITYTNGDVDNPEIFIMVCNSKTRRMEIQYSIFNDGFQITDADYFTIQRYPENWLRMTKPYYAPSVVVYDSGMGFGQQRFAKTMRDLLTPGKWGYVFTFETVAVGYGTLTRGWSEIIPSRIFTRDLLDKNLSDCSDTTSRDILPLVKLIEDTNETF